MAVKKTSTSTKKVSPSSTKKAPAKAAPAKAAPAKAVASSKKPAPKAETKKPASKSPSSGSLAKLWDQESDASKASNFLSEGEHTVRINSMELKVDKKKGAAVFLQVEAIDGEEEGHTGRQMYKLTDENGDKAAGMDYLARDLALLGYEEVSGDQLEETLEEISSNQPMIVVRAKESNTGFLNIFIQGLADDSEPSGGDDNDAEPAEIEVGSMVTFEVDNEPVTGEVLKITDGTARVKTGDGSKYDVDLTDLALADGDAEEPAEIEVGSTVSFDDEGTTRTGEVTKIKKNKATVKDEADDEYEVDLADLTLDDGTGGDAEEPAEIEVGSRVKWDDDDTEREGEVTKLSGDSATVKDDDGDKYKVDVSALTLAD